MKRRYSIVSQTVKKIVAISDGMISSEILRKRDYVQRIREIFKIDFIEIVEYNID
ncbi:hypothetical protein [Acetivibrio clariflavus]|uniref:hypothetical protein n=1 Tax=Acetivibrio clariflavus TaxID=288965 RepID=UPI00030F2F61|nr:hypothetical protein [Acetivibrio clariflavus]